MKWIIAAVLLALSGGVFALECDSSGNQLEINQCAHEEFEHADAQLNQIWQALMDRFKKEKTHVKQLRAAQRAWIKFRDAEVEAMFPCDDVNIRLCWGSMYPMRYSLAMKRLTEARIASLQQHIGSSEPGDSDSSDDSKLVMSTLPAFLGMRPGDKLTDQRDRLTKTVIKTGEGDFDAWAILYVGETVGHIFPDIQDQSRIGSIVITSSDAVTDSGIRVGSTWEDLKDAFPQIPVHGSEIEGQTFANHGHVSYKLNVNFWSYQLSEEELKSIKDDTEIIEIWLR